MERVRVAGWLVLLTSWGTLMTIVQVHPDAESMEFHMQTIGKHIGEAYDQFLDGTERIDVYGVARGGSWR